jgi:hypothetical protein
MRISTKKVCDRNYFFTGRVVEKDQSNFDQWRQLRNLPFGKEGNKETFKLFVEISLNETQFLSSELIKKLENVFIEGTLQEKLNLIVDNFLKWHEKFPYLTTQREITPENAGFPPCALVKAVYWEGEFLGFCCRAIKPPAFDLPRMKIGKLTFKVVTSQDCWDCVELYKKQKKIGVDIFGNISIETIQLHKERIKLSKEPKFEYEKAIDERLDSEGIRRNYKEVKAIFENLFYDKNTKTWKGITEVSKKLGVSIPTIYKLTQMFPEGLH